MLGGLNGGPGSCAATARQLQRSISSALMGTSVMGVGVDIAHTPRLLRLYQRYGNRFLRRVYHDSELTEFERRMSRCEARGAEFLASRWSAKEAAYKALGGGAIIAAMRSDSCPVANYAPTRRLQFPELVVRGDVGGGVSMQLVGTAHALGGGAAGAVDMHLSLSHEEEYTVAVVVVVAPAD